MVIGGGCCGGWFEVGIVVGICWEAAIWIEALSRYVNLPKKMITLHTTKKLLAKLPVDKNGNLPNQSRSPEPDKPSLANNPLSSWHGNLLTLQRRNCILLVHDTTRFAVLITCLKKVDFANLDWWFVDTFMNTLLKCGATNAQMETAHSLLEPLIIDSQCDRSVQGTMNQMKGDLEHVLWYDNSDINDLSAYRLGAWLSDRPCTIKGRKDCIWPIKAMLGLLSDLSGGSGVRYS